MAGPYLLRVTRRLVTYRPCKTQIHLKRPCSNEERRLAAAALYVQEAAMQSLHLYKAGLLHQVQTIHACIMPLDMHHVLHRYLFCYTFHKHANQHSMPSSGKGQGLARCMPHHRAVPVHQRCRHQQHAAHSIDAEQAETGPARGNL
jgi:hypothetical protein